MKSAPSIALAAFLCANLTVLAGPILFTITDLGSLNGATSSANSINKSGQTAGTIVDNQGKSHAFQSTTDITPAGSSGAGASSINGSGQVAGTSYVNGAAIATVWTHGASQYLKTLGGPDSYALGINDFGQVTGLSETASGDGHAFLNTAGVMADLGVFKGGSWSSGYGINAAGQVAGYGNTAQGSFRAFVWSSATGLTQLGTLGGANSYAMSINATGEITGSAQTPGGYLHAFAANGSTLKDLGTLGGTDAGSAAPSKRLGWSGRKCSPLGP